LGYHPSRNCHFGKNLTAKRKDLTLLGHGQKNTLHLAGYIRGEGRA